MTESLQLVFCMATKVCHGLSVPLYSASFGITVTKLSWETKITEIPDRCKIDRGLLWWACCSLNPTLWEIWNEQGGGQLAEWESKQFSPDLKSKFHYSQTFVCMDAKLVNQYDTFGPRHIQSSKLIPYDSVNMHMNDYWQWKWGMKTKACPRLSVLAIFFLATVDFLRWRPRKNELP